MDERDQPEEREGASEGSAEGGIVWVHCPVHGLVIGEYLKAANTHVCPKEHERSWNGPVDRALKDGSFPH